jgi:hypothetical protein
MKVFARVQGGGFVEISDQIPGFRNIVFCEGNPEDVEGLEIKVKGSSLEILARGANLVVEPKSSSSLHITELPYNYKEHLKGVE